MAKSNHVRHSGCRAPLIVAIIVIVLLAISSVSIIMSTLHIGDSSELKEFKSLINQTYDETLFTSDMIQESDYDLFDDKILDNFENDALMLVQNNKFVYENFISTGTRVKNQVIFNEKDFACLLDYYFLDKNKKELSKDFADFLKVLSVKIDTIGNNTTLEIKIKIDTTDFSTALNIKSDLIGSYGFPNYFYITLYTEYDNKSIDKYIINSKIKINALDIESNKKVLSYLNDLFKFKKDYSQIFSDNIIELMRTMSLNWGGINVIFVNNGIRIN